MLVKNTLVLLVTLVASSCISAQNLNNRAEVVEAKAGYVRNVQSFVPDSTNVERATASKRDTTVVSTTVPTTPGLALGEKCTASTQCESDYCKHSKCGTKTKIGSACYKNQGCSSGACNNNKCVGKPTEAIIGDYCNASSQCGTGYCKHNVCEIPSANGHRCYKDSGCTSGNCVGGRCAKDAHLQKLGQHCDTGSNCRSGFCKRGTCDTKKFKGHACYTNQGCLSGHCRNSRCVS